MFLKNRNISSKIKRSKVTDYAALRYWAPAIYTEIELLIIYNILSWLSVMARFASHMNTTNMYNQHPSGRIVQSVTCLATDASLTEDPGVASLIPVQSNTFVEIDHEIISTVILLPSA